jgi:hypothetical protein
VGRVLQPAAFGQGRIGGEWKLQFVDDERDQKKLIGGISLRPEYEPAYLVRPCLPPSVSTN